MTHQSNLNHPAQPGPAPVDTPGAHRRLELSHVADVDGGAAVDDFRDSDGAQVPGDLVRHIFSRADDSINAELARRLAADLTNLEDWLESRPIIEQAKGVLMGHYGIDAETAFQILRRWSSHHNLKVRIISQQLTAAASHCEPSNDSNPSLAVVIASFDRSHPEPPQGNPRISSQR